MFKKRQEQQYQAGFAPIMAKLAHDLELISFLDQQWTFDRKKVEITPGEALFLLILDASIHRTPLYRFPQRIKEWDVSQLLRRPVKEEAVNQFTLGRALDRLYEANPKKVFSEFTAQVFVKEQLSITSVHSDTTSFVLMGEYQENKEQPLAAHGHSKDRRPDLKQVKTGLHVQQDGIPILGEMMRGNLDDKTWCQDMIKDVDDWLHHVSSHPTLLCADAAMMTKKSIENLDKTNLLFVSRVPSSYVVVRKLKERAFAEETWTPLGSFSDQREAADYTCQEYRQTWHGSLRRFFVIWSSSLEKQKQKTVEKDKERQADALRKALNKIGTRHYSCFADAERAKKDYERLYECSPYEVIGTIDTVETPKRKPGRPKAGSTPEVKREYRLELKMGPFKQEWGDTWLKKESTFVLVTNDAKEESVYSAKELLQEYKQQTRVETCFRHLKSPHVVDSFLVEKTERLEAIGYVFLMALLFSRLLEKRVREALNREQVPLITIENMKNHRPTIRVLIHLFQGIHVLVERDGTRWLDEDEWDDRRRKAIRWLGYSEDIFVQTTL